MEASVYLTSNYFHHYNR